MMNTKTFAQSYGEEGPTLSRNALGLVYEGAIEKNVPGKVNIQKVSYMVDGIKAVANVYTPTGYKKDGSYAAIVVAHPNGGSKDQVAGLFAQRLAEDGYVTIAFDARYNGESGGEPHFTDKPANRMGDIMGAIDFIQNYPGVALGEDQRFFLPGAMLAGAAFLSVASVLSKVIIPGALFPVGIVTSFVGVPFFFWIVLTKR